VKLHGDVKQQIFKNLGSELGKATGSEGVSPSNIWSLAKYGT
jgi:hypothetical protein